MLLEMLPLELVHAVLAQAMLVRGLRRALRLRLVNKLFASEVVKLLCELRMLRDVDVPISCIGPIGATYLTHLLLSPISSAMISPQLANLRRIALRLARGDGKADDPEAYAEYIRNLGPLVGFGTLRDLSKPHGSNHHLKQPGKCDHDFLTAAVLMDKISVVDELTSEDTYLRFDLGALPDPFTAAAHTKNTRLIDFLLERTLFHKQSVVQIWGTMLQAASKNGSLDMVEYLLNSKFNPGLNLGREGSLLSFDSALFTPDVEIFKILMLYKEDTLKRDFAPYIKSPYAQKMLADLLQLFTEKEMARRLRFVASEGWDKMVNHLLGMGAQTDSCLYHPVTPLVAACESGSVETVQVLLQHKANITGSEIETAAQKGHIGIVRALLEHGVDCNTGRMPPIVSAVRLERVDMFELLMEHGAQLESAGPIAAEVARDQGLDSMLALLERYMV